jgi:branched-subunit amino acid aminotransferase/4-amino-4-deoxychorismate lyase
MLPRNAIAIRKTLGAAKTAEIITALTHKTSTATLLDYPPGAYTGMRTFDKLGIMDFPGHTARLTNSLQQIRFPSQDPLKDINGEATAATLGLASLRRPDVMKEEATSLVKAGLKFYYNNRPDALGPADETKVTVLCTWDPKV